MKNTLTLIGALCAAIVLAAVAGQESIADTQDEQAISSRDWAAKQVCGDRTAVWPDDKTVECVKEKP